MEQEEYKIQQPNNINLTEEQISNTNQTNKHKPDRVYSFKGVRVPVWLPENNKGRDKYKLVSTWKDDNGQYQESPYFTDYQLMALREVIDQIITDKVITTNT